MKSLGVRLAVAIISLFRGGPEEERRSRVKNLNKLLKQAQKMQQRMMKEQEEIQRREFEGSAGGGVVRIRLNGDFELLEVRIDPAVVDPEDVEMLQDLVLAAVNDGVRKVKDATQERLSALTGGLEIPGFQL